MVQIFRRIKKRMDKETPTLSIKDIVLLKERPQDYLKIITETLTKTHDGTSMGKIGPVLDAWGEKTTNWFMEKEVSVFDSDGKERGSRIGTRTGGPWSCKIDNETVYRDDEWVTPQDFSDNSGYTNMHWIETSVEGREGHKYDIGTTIKESGAVSLHEQAGANVPRDEHPLHNEGTCGVLTVPSQLQLNQLCSKNENGEYALKSYSMVSRNGTRITAIKNDSFNTENEAPYKQVTKDLEKATINYSDTYQKTYSDIAQRMIDNHEYPDSINGHKLIRPYDIRCYVEHKAQQETLNQIGTWEQNVLKGQGFDKRMEDQNVKIRVSRVNTDNHSRFRDYDDSTWNSHDNYNEIYERNGTWGEDSPWYNRNRKVEPEKYDYSKAGYEYLTVTSRGSKGWVNKETQAYEDLKSRRT